MFDLDHQRLIFSKHYKTFAWKSTNNENCELYEMKPTSCDSDSLSPITTIGVNTTITISNSDLRDEHGAYYFWRVILAATNQTENVCQEIVPYIVVNESGINCSYRSI